MIDLNPVGAVGSQINGMAPGQQVGVAGGPITGFQSHAAMWHGSAASFVDMNPPSAALSVLYATCGSAQVGTANVRGLNTAGIWFGTARSFVPLHEYLPGQYRQSIATGVSEVNGVFYVSGFANSRLTNRDEAVLWIGVPTPGTAAVAASAAGVLSARRARR